MANGGLDVLAMLLLVALFVRLMRQDARQTAGLEMPLPARPQTPIENILLLELTAGMMALVAILRLIYAAQDDGWKELLANRWPSTESVRIKDGMSG